MNRIRIASLLLVNLVLLATSLIAQDSAARQHPPRYKLVDLGTFGGRASFVNPAWELGGPKQMNLHGTTVGSAATSEPTPLGCPFCNGLDGQVHTVFHAFRWSNGTLLDMGALPGDLTNSVAISVNSGGTAVGHSENGKIDPITGGREFRAVLWEEGRIKNLGTFGGNFSLAFMINNRGQVAGSALNSTPDPLSFLGLFLGSSDLTQTRVFLWENGYKIDLGTLGGPDSFGGLINDRGEVIGVSYTDSVPNPTTGLPTLHPFLWRSGKMIDLGNFGGNLASVVGINNRSQIVGALSVPGDESIDPFFWDDGKLVDLYSGSKGGSAYTGNAINEDGKVIGAAAFPGHPYNAYVWENGVARDLGFLEGDCYSEAFVINSKGQIAGQSYSCDGTTARAFLWQNGTIFELNQLIPVNSGFRFTQAFVINDRGEIAGVGTPPGCNFDEDCGHALLLIPCEWDDDDRAYEQAVDRVAGFSNVDLPIKERKPAGRYSNLTGRDLAAALQSRFGPKYRVGVPPLR
jgi:probable HAF family extracellular repeat protein